MSCDVAMESVGMQVQMRRHSECNVRVVRSQSIDSDVVDLSFIFWDFVRMVTELDYDDLCRTQMFEVFGSAVCDLGLPLGLRWNTLVDSSGSGLGSGLGTSQSLSNVDYDDRLKMIIVDDCEELFQTVHKVVHHAHAAAGQSQTCTARMR